MFSILKDEYFSSLNTTSVDTIHLDWISSTNCVQKAYSWRKLIFPLFSSMLPFIELLRTIYLMFISYTFLQEIFHRNLGKGAYLGYMYHLLAHLGAGTLKS